MMRQKTRAKKNPKRQTRRSDKLLAEQVKRFKFLRRRDWFTFYTMKDDKIDSTCHVYESCWLNAFERAQWELAKGDPRKIHFEGENE
jgi:hypothetical protein